LETFLIENGMSVLVPFFEWGMHVNGYGNINTIPAFYGFTMLPPYLVINTDIREVVESFSNLFQRIGSLLDIRLNVNIHSVTRSRNEVTVVYDSGNAITTTEKYDFIVLACGLQNTAGWLDTRKEESQIISFFDPNPTLFAVSILSSFEWGSLPLGDCSNSATYENPSNGEVSNIFADVGILYQNVTEYPEVRVHYQIVNGFSEEEAIAIRDSELSAWFGVQETNTILFNFGLKYSPRFTNAGFLSRIPWKVWDLQGRYLTWYIGASVSLDAVEVMIDYNHQLIDTFGKQLSIE